MTKNMHVRRCVRFVGLSQGEIATFRSKSWTRRRLRTYFMHCDLQTGEVMCDCPDFQIRRSKKRPSLFSPPDHLCKHLRRIRRRLTRRFEPVLPGLFEDVPLERRVAAGDSHLPLAA